MPTIAYILGREVDSVKIRIPLYHVLNSSVPVSVPGTHDYSLLDAPYSERYRYEHHTNSFFAQQFFSYSKRCWASVEVVPQYRTPVFFMTRLYLG